jgi:arylsulfatase A-like enzyme
MGAWVGYGLGSANRDLPGFIVLNGGLIPPGGLDNFNAGFLPAAYQGSVFRAGNPPVANLGRLEATDRQQRGKLDLIRDLDRAAQVHTGTTDAIESAIANWETAYRMQASVPGLMDIRSESEATRKLYGLDAAYAPTRLFAAQCLIARRLVERGARFLELTCPSVGHDRWDQHGNLHQGHEDNARAVDQPIAALLKDLKARGLLDETLVVWAGEFGRTPFAQGADGRDHNQFAFTVWLAGGGVKGGYAHGETDAWGYKVVKDRVEIHDLHATMLHLLGIDHKRLTFRFGGRDMRLTDVHGELVHDILA